MKFLSLTLLVIASVHAAASIKLGTFSLFTESEWGAAFELQKNGKAIITPQYSWDVDTPAKKRPKPKTMNGTWTGTKDGIEIVHGTFKDRFKLEPRCADWDEHPCFRFEKSLIANDKKSPLNFDLPYINFDWKADQAKEVSQKCLADCAEMIKKGELKAGMTTEECAKSVCK